MESRIKNLIQKIEARRALQQLRKELFKEIGSINPLCVAVYHGNYEVVKLLIEEGADVTVDDNLSIRLAVKYGYTNIVKLLIEAGADVNVHDNILMILSLRDKHYDIVNLLLDAGADDSLLRCIKQSALDEIASCKSYSNA